MKRHTIFGAALALFIMVFAVTAGHAVPKNDLMQTYGVSDADASVLEAITGSVGQGMTAEEEAALVRAYFGEGKQAFGTVSEDLYTHPIGFSMRVPEGWQLFTQRLGSTALMTGPQDDSGFSPTIHLQVLAEQPAFDTFSKEQADALYQTVLPKYQFVDLEAFIYQGANAHEFVCVHGTEAGAMLIQYQVFFNKGGMAYIITMTTRAEEAAHESALEIYDRFLTNFAFTQQQPAGQDGKGPVQTIPVTQPTADPGQSGGSGNG